MTAPTVVEKELGVSFADEMVRALLLPPTDPHHKDVTRRTSSRWANVQPGRLVWVRECWAPAQDHPRSRVAYRASGMSYGLNGGWALPGPNGEEGGLLFPSRLGIDVPVPKRWIPGIHMPRWASRKLLRVVSVTPEPVVVDGVLLPCVTDAEGRREGVAGRGAYLELWRKLNGRKPVPAVVYRIELSHNVGGGS